MTTETPDEPAPSFTYRDLQRGILLASTIYLALHYQETLTPLLLFFLLVFILSAVMNPPVVWLQRRFGIPRIGGAILIALGLLAALGLVLWGALPPLLEEVSRFIGSLDEKQATVTRWYDELMRRYPELRGQIPPPSELFKNLTPWMSRLLGTVGQYTANVLGGVVSLVLMLVLVIFTVSQPAPLVAGLLGAVPERHRGRAQHALKRILEQLSNWARGSLLLGLIVGVVCGVLLRAIGVPYALLFGVIAGIGELIPSIGPILSALPPALIALMTGDPSKAAGVLVIFLVVQQVENNFLVPYVMGQTLDLHPVSVMGAVLLMGVLFGLTGAILAVPVCAIIKVLWQEFYLAPRAVDPVALEKAAQEIVDGPLEPPQRSPRKRNQRREEAAGTDAGKPATSGSEDAGD